MHRTALVTVTALLAGAVGLVIPSCLSSRSPGTHPGLRVVDRETGIPVKEGWVSWDPSDPWRSAFGAYPVRVGAPGYPALCLYLAPGDLEAILGPDAGRGVARCGEGIPEIGLYRGQALTGSVADREGRPIEGVEVHARGFLKLLRESPHPRLDGSTIEWSDEDRTDTDGRFRIRCLTDSDDVWLDPPGEGGDDSPCVHVGFEKEGYLFFEDCLPMGRSARIVLERPQAEPEPSVPSLDFSGTGEKPAGKPLHTVEVDLVDAEGSPVPGVRPEMAEHGAATTDPRGRAVWTNIPAGEHEISVPDGWFLADTDATKTFWASERYGGSGEGIGEWSGEGIELDVPEESIARMTIVPGVRLTGLVVDRRGAPLPGARVVQMRRAIHGCVTDDRGRFELIVPGLSLMWLPFPEEDGDPFSVVIGYSESPERRIALRDLPGPGETLDLGRIRLDALRNAALIVKIPDFREGLEWVGIVLWAYETGERVEDTYFDPGAGSNECPMEGIPVLGALRAPRGGPRPVENRSRPSLRFPCIRTYDCPTDPPRSPLKGGRGKANVDLGEAAGTRESSSPVGCDRQHRERLSRSPAEKLPPGTYVVLFDRPGFLPWWSDPISLDPGECRTLVPAFDRGSTITGTVLDAETGRPVRATVDGYQGNRYVGQCACDSRGRFGLTGFALGPAALHAVDSLGTRTTWRSLDAPAALRGPILLPRMREEQREEGETAPAEPAVQGLLPQDETPGLDAPAPPSGSIRGIVRSERSASSVLLAVWALSVELQGEGASLSTQVDRNGKFSFPEIPAGRYELRYPIGALGLVRARVDVRAGEVASADLVYRGLRLRGTVRMADGTAAAGARIGIESARMSWAEQAFAASPEGGFEIFGVPAGKQTIWCDAPGIAPQPMVLDMTEDRTIEIVLPAPPPGARR
ncbi:MAG: carboxypeptidase regulatory-like domain-containing protein [Planctomycetes bacterium]|nr:carboxypeptidase regulatory-like domain-containing protein [Planctomycetota bacterium]